MNANRYIPLYLFAKAPVPGRVKTRIANKIGHKNCARLAEMMIEDSIEQVLASWNGPLILAVSPNPEHKFFQSIVERYELDVITQNGSDLGVRMFNALHEGVNKWGLAAVMGCDVPHISPENLNYAQAMLVEHGSVIGPAEDGGFYLLGISHQNPNIFTDIVWGGSSVCLGVETNYRKLGMHLSRCDTLRDIDTPTDLKWLADRNSRYSTLLDSD